MSSTGHLHDDPVFAALEALHFPADELAAALGIDVKALWAYHFGDRGVPPFVVRRLINLLEERASLLRDVAATLEAGRPSRRLAAVS